MPFQQPNYQRAPRDRTNERIGERSRFFSDDFITSYPGLTARLIMGNAPDEHIRQFGQGLRSAFDFIDQQNLIAGVPGAFNNLRSRVSQFSDPGVRTQGLDILDQIQSMDQARQTILLSYLFAGDDKLVPGKTPDEKAQYIQQLLQQGLAGPGQRLDFTRAATGREETGLQLELGGQGDINRLAAIKAIFPGGGAVSGGQVDTWADEAIDEFRKGDNIGMDMLYSIFHGWIENQYALEEGEITTGQAILGNIASIPSTALGLHPVFLQYNLAGNIAGRALRGPGGGTLGPKIADIGSGVVENTIGRVFKFSEDHVAKPVAGMFGLKEGDVGYDNVVEGLTALAGLGVLHYLGKASSAVKVSRGNVPIAARNILEIAESPLARAGEGVRSIFGSETLGRAAAKLSATLHMPEYWLQRAINSRFQVSIEDWGASRRGGLRLLDEVKRASEGDSPHATLFRRYGEHYNGDLFDALLAVDEAQRPQVLVDFIKRDAPQAAVEQARATVAGTELAMLDRQSRIVSPEEFNELSNTAEGLLRRRKALLDSGVSRTDPTITSLETAARQIIEKANEHFRAQQELDLLFLEQAAAEAKLRDTSYDGVQPVESFPKRQLVRAAVLEPNGRMEGIIHAMLTVKGTIDPYKLVDELGHINVLWHRGRSDSPIGAGDLNLDTLTKVLNRLKVPKAKADAFIEKYDRVGKDLERGKASDQDFYDLNKELATLIDESLPKGTPPEVRLGLTRFMQQAIEGKTRNFVAVQKTDASGRTTTVYEPVAPRRLSDGSIDALPSRPSEFKDHVVLPDVDLMIEASSWLRNAMRRLKAEGRIGATAADFFYYLPKKVLNISTLFGKPTVLGPRFGAVALRQQGEQAIRSSMMGYDALRLAPEGFTLFPGGIPLPFGAGKTLFKSFFGDEGISILGKDPRLQGIEPPTPEIVGSIRGQLTEGLDSVKVEVRTADYAAGRAAPDGRVFTGWAEQLQQAGQDLLFQRLARNGVSMRAVIEEAKTNPTLRRYLQDQSRALSSEGSVLAEGTSIPVDLGTVRNVPAAEAGSVPWDYDYYAHVTPSGNIPGIINEGLKPSSTTQFLTESQRANIPADSPMLRDRLFAGESPQLAFDAYGRPDGVVLRVKKSDFGEVTTDATRGGSVWGDRPIPPDKIEILTEEGWKPLVEEVKPTPEETMAEWANRSTQAADDLLADPDVRRLVATGRPPGRRVVDPETGMEHGAAFERASTDYATITDRLRSTPRTPENLDIIRELQRERWRLMGEMDRLSQEGGPTANRPNFKLSDTRRLAKWLEERWNNGELEMPGIVVARRGVRARGSDQSPGEAVHEMAIRYSQAMYSLLRPTAWADLKGTRGSLYYSVAEQKLRIYREMGLPEGEALARAQFQAGKITRDIMYDLGARTSVQRALKDIFWFGPALQEVLYTWLVKIPSQSYWPIGAALLAGKTAGTIKLLKSMGIISEDPDGDNVITVPGLTGFLNATLGNVFGIKVPDVAYGRLSGLNFVTTNPFPSLSPLPAWALAQAARKTGGVFKGLSDVLLPYGLDIEAFPNAISYGWEAITGEPFPIEFLSPGASKHAYDRSYDQALQYAFADLSRQGIKPPRPEAFMGDDKELNFAEEEKYRAAVTDYTANLMSLGKEYLRGTATVRFLGSTVSPMSLYTTTKEKQAWEKFWNDVIAPADESGVPFDEQREMISSYLDDHPNSVAYSIYYSKLGEKVHELPYDSEGDDAIYDEYYTGERVTMTPEEFSRHLQIMDSYRVYTSRLDTTLREISPDLKASELLRNGWQRAQALARYYEEWERYQYLNPQAAGELKQARDKFKEVYGIPIQTFQAQRLADTIHNLQQVSGLFTGETGVRIEDFRSVLGQLKGAFSEDGIFGRPTTQTEKDMAWYYKNRLVPYMEETADLYDQANQLSAAGISASAVYDKIDEINARYATMGYGHNGQNYPTPEEALFSNKPPGEQDAARWHWATQPPYWLSTFRRQQAGYAQFDGADQFYDDWSAVETAFDTAMEQRGVTPGSDLADRYEKAKLQQLQALASQYGPEALQAVALGQATPIARLGQTGFGAGDQYWAATQSMAQQIVDRLRQHGYSERGYSAYALEYKQWLYQQIENWRAQDPAYDRLWVQLSYAVPDKGFTQKEGVPLYESILFGAFNADFAPDSLTQIGLTNIGGS